MKLEELHKEMVIPDAYADSELSGTQYYIYDLGMRVNRTRFRLMIHLLLTSMPPFLYYHHLPTRK